MAPADSESSGHTVVAPVVFSGTGTRAAASVLAAATVPGGARAHPRSEEPIMNFTLRLLDGDPSAMKKPLVLSPGSAIRLEARVDFSPGISLKIYVDQCYGTSSEQPGHSRRVFMVVNSRGCLHGQKLGSVAVQHQRGVSALRLTIPAPVLEDEPEEVEVYVHCLLTAWRHGARSCFYSQATASWHNAEDPSRSALCHCCDTGCPPGDTFPGDLPGFPGEGTLHQETVGPLLVQKEKVPWYEAPCRTVKRFLLAGLALVGSAVVAATLVGGLLGLALAAWRLVKHRQRRRRPRRQCPFHAELQSVVGALVSREWEKGGEVGPDYRSLAQGSA
ncbi:zona pellucida sperm-binding protein 3-like [Gymnogyps californianus]|uniref:zona pellucida sperm-binding protein 3-like n=1 Tax=Gymnogyps californianus TaxID=33616 RepID=UPI0021C6EF2C|nr:zona pellucida sperm-binding protein 3-like [Gymnogyps californianus]